MKVVLFCGGLGMRLREYSEIVPKPLIPVGDRPLLWHLMKYYAHWGHTDFILCLGHRGDAIRHYFRGYQDRKDAASIKPAGEEADEVARDDWRVTFVDTGLTASIGQRLKAVEQHLDGEETFLANYADGLTNLALPDQISHFERRGALASFLSVRPNLSYHRVIATSEGRVTDLRPIASSGLRINGGFFVFRREVLQFIHRGEDLVEEPFRRLIRAGKLTAYRYDGFWQAVDTVKDKARVDELVAAGNPPWQVWADVRGRLVG